MRACSRPMMITVLLMILSRDTTMSWMCLKVFPCEKQEPTVRKRRTERWTSIVELSKMKTLGRYYSLRESFCSLRCSCIKQAASVQPFIINRTNGEVGGRVLRSLQASSHQNWRVLAECHHFTVCYYNVFTIKRDFSEAWTEGQTKCLMQPLWDENRPWCNGEAHQV